MRGSNPRPCACKAPALPLRQSPGRGSGRAGFRWVKYTRATEKGLPLALANLWSRPVLSHSQSPIARALYLRELFVPFVARALYLREQFEGVLCIYRCRGPLLRRPLRYGRPTRQPAATFLPPRGPIGALRRPAADMGPLPGEEPRSRPSTCTERPVPQDSQSEKRIETLRQTSITAVHPNQIELQERKWHCRPSPLPSRPPRHLLPCGGPSDGEQRVAGRNPGCHGLFLPPAPPPSPGSGTVSKGASERPFSASKMQRRASNCSRRYSPGPSRRRVAKTGGEAEGQA